MKEEIDNLFELDNILNNNFLKDHTTEKIYFGNEYVFDVWISKKYWKKYRT